jgi:cell filamentation protein
MRDPYVYEGTNVLINEGNIRDQTQLDVYENALTSLALANLLADPIVVSSCLDILEIHRRLFEKVYPFAGEIRTIDIYKNEPVLGGLSVNYAHYETIRRDLQNLTMSMETVEWNKIKKNELASDIALYLATLWKIHPFREGNTRACTVFMLFFLKQRHIRLNESFLAKYAKYFRNALVLYSVDEAPEKDHLEGMLDDAVSAKIETESGKKYETLGQYKVKNYQYGYHHLKNEEK